MSDCEHMVPHNILYNTPPNIPSPQIYVVLVTFQRAQQERSTTTSNYCYYNTTGSTLYVPSIYSPEKKARHERTQKKETKINMSILVVDFSTVSPNPLNPLGLKLRKYIWESLDQAEKDPNITSIILTGGKKNFSAGADLTEFGQIQANAAGGSSPSSSSGGAPFYMLTELVSKIENCTKPVIAAISGNALGGGLEVALSCHYRITDGTGKFGLPEVNVGVIPGAGGTQRLPRLVTVPVALDMILTGRVINTKKAKDIGLVDHIAVDSKSTSDLLQHAEKWAKWAALMPLKDRRIGHMKVKESTEELHQIFSYAKKKLPSVEMGGEGVHAAWEAVRACTLPIKQGMEVEEEQFLTTLAGEQGNARRHAFFAVRKAQKPIGKLQGGHVLLKKQSMTNPQDRTTVAVVGAGLMGSGICMVLLQAGFIVHLVDIYKASLDKGVSFLTGTIKSYVKRGKLPAKRAEQMLSSLKPSQKLEDLKACKLVVEAVIEDMKIKKKIFTALDKITPSDCILLSNTSTLDIDEMASVLRPSRQSLFAGWHFFSPAHIMKLVEIVVGKETSLQTSIVIQQLTKRIGKIGVVVGNCDGFVGNRLLISYGAETTLLLEEGAATVARVDKAFLKFGIALGPFQMADLAGLDIGYNIRKQRGWVNPDGTWTEKCPKRYPRIADVIVSQYQRLGQKSGKVRGK